VSSAEVLDWSVTFTLVALSLGLLLTFVRLVLGPSLSDRVVALDLMAIMAVGLIAVYTIRSDEAAFLDAGIVLALIAFLGTVTFARYIRRQIEP
jgi:multicomponent Na+:H+ antiporter subunit F